MTQPFNNQVKNFKPVYRQPWPTKEELKKASVKVKPKK